MGFLDKVKDAVGGNKKRSKAGVDKGADFIDGRTEGKYTDKIDKGGDSAKDAIDKLPD